MVWLVQLWALVFLVEPTPLGPRSEWILRLLQALLMAACQCHYYFLHQSPQIFQIQWQHSLPVSCPYHVHYRSPHYKRKQ